MFDLLSLSLLTVHQGELPVGATIVPIILASNKTPVSRQTGNLEMHPLFLTIGNIRSDLQMKATAHAWSCIAYSEQQNRSNN